MFTFKVYVSVIKKQKKIIVKKPKKRWKIRSH
jgi:hypothetical protein